MKSILITIDGFIEDDVRSHDSCQVKDRQGHEKSDFEIYMDDGVWLCDGCHQPMTFETQGAFMADLAARVVELTRQTEAAQA